MVLPTFRVGFPTSVNLILIILLGETCLLDDFRSFPIDNIKVNTAKSYLMQVEEITVAISEAREPSKRSKGGSCW